MSLYFYVSDPGSECAGDRVKGNFWQMTCRRRSRHTERELQDIAERLFRVRTAIDHISGCHNSTFLRSKPDLRSASRLRVCSVERGSCQVLRSLPDRLSSPLRLSFRKSPFMTRLLEAGESELSEPSPRRKHKTPSLELRNEVLVRPGHRSLDFGQKLLVRPLKVSAQCNMKES